MKRLLPLALALYSSAGLASGAAAQCILANPSFEVGAAGSQVFGGWNQFGIVGSTPDAPHGQVAARVSGPNSGRWDVSACWQRLDCSPGDQWQATVTAWHESGKPLMGANRALLNIEWRDAGGQLISNESHDVLDANSPLGERTVFSVLSGPAPPGTVATHFLLGVIQSPTDPQPDVYFDQARFELQTSPSIEESQWNDFPGGRTLDFAGHSWRIKGPGYYDPGSDFFCDAPECLWVDTQGDLHLTIDNPWGPWHSVEIALEETLGYGDYVFTTRGALDQLDPQVVLGLFLWEYGPCWSPSLGWWNPYNEIDVEISRWGNPNQDLAQFVAQPYDWPGNISRFDFTADSDELTSHAFLWLANRLEYRSWRGGPQDENPGSLIHSYTYTGPHIPRPERPRVHMNFWQLQTPASPQEVIVDDFTFVPWCDGEPCGGPVAAPPTPLAPELGLKVQPNPFNPTTSVRFDLPESGWVGLRVFDLAGRLVRNLIQREFPSGESAVSWHGKDDSGRGVGSGVYLVQLQWRDVVETRRVSLVK